MRQSQSQDRAARQAIQGVTLAATVLFPTGVLPPENYWLCDGQTPARQRLPEVFAEIGETFGAGDGATTFALPDLTAAAPANYSYWIWAGRARDPD